MLSGDTLHEIVHLFVSAKGRVIPRDVERSILMFCPPLNRSSYESNGDQIHTEIISTLYQPNTKRNKTFWMTQSGSVSPIFWHIGLHVRGGGVFTFTVHIDCVNSGPGPKSPRRDSRVLIGIQDASAVFPNGFYGWDQHGTQYRNSETSTNSQMWFDAGDNLTLRYHSRNGLLTLRKQQHASVRYSLRGITPGQCSKFAVYLEGENNQITEVKNVLKVMLMMASC